MNVPQIKIPVINVIMQFPFKLNKYNFKKILHVAFSFGNA